MWEEEFVEAPFWAPTCQGRRQSSELAQWVEQSSALAKHSFYFTTPDIVVRVLASLGLSPEESQQFDLIVTRLLLRRPDLPHYGLSLSDLRDMTLTELRRWDEKIVSTMKAYKPSVIMPVQLYKKK